VKLHATITSTSQSTRNSITSRKVKVNVTVYTVMPCDKGSERWVIRHYIS